MSWAAMLTAISGTVLELISNPIGAYTFANLSSGDTHVSQIVIDQLNLSTAANQTDIPCIRLNDTVECFLIVLVSPV